MRALTGLPSTLTIPLYYLTVLPGRLYCELSKQWALALCFIPWQRLPAAWLAGWLIDTHTHSSHFPEHPCPADVTTLVLTQGEQAMAECEAPEVRPPREAGVELP